MERSEEYCEQYGIKRSEEYGKEYCVGNREKEDVE
jgi:hypothetical protein